MIIDHIGPTAGNYNASKEFFRKALAPLSIELVVEVQGWAGLGRIGKPELWFGAHSEMQKPMHIAFIADSREQVRTFHAVALAAGGTDNGLPGIHEIYHPHYYGAIDIGPNGYNIEAVCHSPPRGMRPE